MCSNSIPVGITVSQRARACVHEILASSSAMTPTGRAEAFSTPPCRSVNRFACLGCGAITLSRTSERPYMSTSRVSTRQGLGGVRRSGKKKKKQREEWPSSALPPEGFHYTQRYPLDLLLGKRRRSNGVKSESPRSPEGRDPMKRTAT